MRHEHNHMHCQLHSHTSCRIPTISFAQYMHCQSILALHAAFHSGQEQLALMGGGGTARTKDRIWTHSSPNLPGVRLNLPTGLGFPQCPFCTQCLGQSPTQGVEWTFACEQAHASARAPAHVCVHSCSSRMCAYAWLGPLNPHVTSLGIALLVSRIWAATKHPPEITGHLTCGVDDQCNEDLCED